MIALLNSCGESEKRPDVSGIKVSLNSRRFDKGLRAVDTNAIAVGLQQLKATFPDFTDFYLDTLMGFGVNGNYTDTNEGIQKRLKGWLTHKDYRGVFDTVAKHYPDTKDVDAQLQKGFEYMKYYYPNYQVPNIVYFVSGLNRWQAFVGTNNNIGIGLDMFLGEQYPFYASVGIEAYMGRHMIPEYIPVAVFSVIYEDMVPYRQSGASLLDMMIQKGKQQYFLRKMLPFVSDETRLAYSKKQLEDCESNKTTIFNYFISNNLFYEKNLQKVIKFVNDGPDTKDISKDCPGNIGTWLGYQIVLSYMKQYPETTLPQLFANTDAQKFLQDSKYNPK